MLLALLAIAIPFALVSIPFNVFVSSIIWKKVGALLLTAVVLSAYAAYVRMVEKRAVTELSGPHALRELGAGLLLGALLVSLTIGVLAALGVYRITGYNGWTAALASVPGFVLAVALEEVVFRAILFRILNQWLGTWIALVLSAAVFGLLHLLNPGATVLNAASVMMEAGILLAAAYLLTRRLWLCMGIHFAWNFAQGGIFSSAVSGGVTQGLLQAKLVGAAWLSGGAFGAEASVVALLTCTTAGLLLLRAAAGAGNIVQRSETGPIRVLDARL
jgi:membrane protease YdiL (CAAX protease family)